MWGGANQGGFLLSDDNHICIDTYPIIFIFSILHMHKYACTSIMYKYQLHLVSHSSLGSQSSPWVRSHKPFRSSGAPLWCNYPFRNLAHWFERLPWGRCNRISLYRWAHWQVDPQRSDEMPPWSPCPDYTSLQKYVPDVSCLMNSNDFHAELMVHFSNSLSIWSIVKLDSWKTHGI